MFSVLRLTPYVQATFQRWPGLRNMKDINCIRDIFELSKERITLASEEARKNAFVPSKGINKS